jgi:hypothetical protein
MATLTGGGPGNKRPDFRTGYLARKVLTAYRVLQPMNMTARLREISIEKRSYNALLHIKNTRN